MRRPAELQSILMAFFGALLFVQPLSAAKPNFIFILCDDLGFGDVSVNNPDSKIMTPNIDSLAREGMRFTSAYSNDAVCTPTRYGTLTGRYCWRSRLKRGVLKGWDATLIEHGRWTTGTVLQKNGYTTAVIGKWHLGVDWALIDPSKPAVGPDQRGTNAPAKSSVNIDFTKPLTYGPREYGFDYSFIFPGSLNMSPYFYIRNDTVVDPEDPVWRRPNFDQCIVGYAAKSFKVVECVPTLTDSATAFIRHQVTTNPEKPFYLHFTIPAPHTPWAPTDEFKEKMKERLGKGWAYGAFVEQTDHCLGQIMKTVDSMGIRENTVIVFTSDNGAEKFTCKFVADYKHWSNSNLRGYKRDTWEGGVCVPFFIRWPGVIEAGSVTDEPVCLTDFMATAAAIVGYKLPEHTGEDSYSILPVLLGKKLDTPVKQATVVHSLNNGYAIIQGKWKFIDGKGSNNGNPYPISGCAFTKSNSIFKNHPAGQLYDMDANPTEKYSENLYATEAGIRKSLDSLLEVFKTGDRSAPAVRTYKFYEELIDTTSDSTLARPGHSATALPMRVLHDGSLLSIRGKGAITVDLYDLAGKRIIHREGKGTLKVHLPRSISGTCIARISDGKDVVSRRLCVLPR